MSCSSTSLVTRSCSSTSKASRFRQLKEIVRGTEQFAKPKPKANLLRLPTGDGGRWFFELARKRRSYAHWKLRKHSRAHPELHVRMGIHSGPVNEVTDVNEQANIAGAGINIAQRVMDCGDAGTFFFRSVSPMTWSIIRTGSPVARSSANAK